MEDKTILYKGKPDLQINLGEDNIKIDWKLFDKIIQAKHERGTLNFPTDVYSKDDLYGVPVEKIKAGDCIDVRGYRSIVFEHCGRLWFRFGTRKEILTLPHHTFHVNRVVFTAEQVEQVKRLTN